MTSFILGSGTAYSDKTLAIEPLLLFREGNFTLGSSSVDQLKVLIGCISFNDVICPPLGDTFSDLKPYKLISLFLRSEELSIYSTFLGLLINSLICSLILDGDFQVALTGMKETADSKLSLFPAYIFIISRSQVLCLFAGEMLASK